MHASTSPYRRRFLAGAAGWLAPGLARARARAAPSALWPPGIDRAGLPRELWITRPQAQETTRAIYWADGRLQPDGYRSINRIYRDLYAGLERPIAVKLLNLNYVLQQAVAYARSPRPLVLLSGFRTVATNLRVGGVEPSAHQSGEADDFIYEGLTLDENFRLALLFQVGGLGLYPDRGSLHKDLGAPRIWVQFGRAPARADSRAIVIHRGH